MTEEAVEVLTRWERAGGTWHVVAHSSSAATVTLCRCDGGEEVDRLTSTDPRLLAFLGSRSSSDDAWQGSSDPRG